MIMMSYLLTEGCSRRATKAYLKKTFVYNKNLYTVVFYSSTIRLAAAVTDAVMPTDQFFGATCWTILNYRLNNYNFHVRARIILPRFGPGGATIAKSPLRSKKLAFAVKLVKLPMILLAARLWSLTRESLLFGATFGILLTVFAVDYILRFP